MLATYFPDPIEYGVDSHIVEVIHSVVDGARVAAGLLVTGQTVVETATVDVMTTVLRAGQTLTVGAQDVVV